MYSLRQTRSHVFDGLSVPQSSSFQLCDILDPEIDTKGTTRAKCSKTSGWYSQSFLDKLRKQVKRKLRKLKGENVESDSEEATSDEEEEEEELDGETSEEEEEEESAPEPEIDVTEKVRSKVNEMMRSLQASQKDAQQDGKIFAHSKNLNARQQDMEELEMFDVFDGDDSSDSEYEDS